MKKIRGILGGIRQADQRHTLIQNGDKILVGVSGGKDSMCLLFALSQYQKFSSNDFEIIPATLDLGFPGFDVEPIKKYVSSLGYELKVIDSKDVYTILSQHKIGNKLPCSICSRMKKAAMNKVANDLGCNKVAFAHHMDDAVETLFMNEIYGAKIATFSPKMTLDRAGITFIRPFIYIREEEISKCVKEENIPFFPSYCTNDGATSRKEIKDLLTDLYKKNDSSYENFGTMLTNIDHQNLWEDQIYLKIENTPLSCKEVNTVQDYIEVQNLRLEIFVKEQGFTLDVEFDKEEKDSKHYLIYDKNEIIGTFSYIQRDEHFIFWRRLALKKDARGKGYGRKILVFFENYLSRMISPLTIEFDGEQYLKDFYLSLGFDLGQEIIEEEPCPPMYRFSKTIK